MQTDAMTAPITCDWVTAINSWSVADQAIAVLRDLSVAAVDTRNAQIPTEKPYLFLITDIADGFTVTNIRSQEEVMIHGRGTNRVEVTSKLVGIGSPNGTESFGLLITPHGDQVLERAEQRFWPWQVVRLALAPLLFRAQ
jgi:hypothetical protein